MTPSLIALHGPAEVGKSTVARLIAEALPGRRVVVDSFAGPLKRSAGRALGFDRDPIRVANLLKANGTVTVQFYDEDGALVTRTLSGREYLEKYGTEGHREEFGDDFWLEKKLPDVSATRYGRDDEFDVLVFDDLRFVNEAERVYDCGGEVWELDRHDFDPIDPDGHDSRRPLPDSLVSRRLVIDGFDDEGLSRLRHAVEDALHPTRYVVGFDPGRWDARGVVIRSAHDFGGIEWPADAAVMVAPAPAVVEPLDPSVASPCPDGWTGRVHAPTGAFVCGACPNPSACVDTATCGRADAIGVVR